MRYSTLAVVDAPAGPGRDRGGLWRIPMAWLGLLLAVVLSLINAATPTPVHASTSGPLMAGTGTDVPGPGSYAWAGPENVTADDTGYASVTLPPDVWGNYHTHYLCGTNFGFNIPSGSTINGIQATIGRMMSGGGSGIHDDLLYLIKGGTIAGDDKSEEVDWPNMVIGEAYYGGSTDNWGLTWTAEDINASNFGVALSVKTWSWVANYTAYVDYMQMTVTYTLPGTTTTIATSGTPSTYGDSVTFTATVSAGAGANTPSGSVTLKEGGTTIGTGTLSGSGGVATVTFSTSTMTVGTHDNITAVYGGDSNFTGSTSSSISQTVNARPLTITASSSSKTYGDTVTFAGTEFTTAGLVNSDTVTSVTLTSTGAGASAAVGTYSIVPSAAVGTGLSNYSISYANGTLTVSQKALTITANNRSKTYGDVVTFAGTEFTTSGLVNSDTVTSVTLASSGTGSAAAAGTYSIVPSAAVGSGLSNYSISYVNGTLTVNQKALTITAHDRSKTYGDAVTFAGTEFTPSGLVNSDAVTSVTLTSSGASADATVAASPYSIVPSAAAGSGLSNYAISYVNGSLTVGAKALTVTADSRSKTYGDTVTFAGTEFTSAGLVAGDSVDGVTLTSTGAEASAAVGTYPILPSAAAGTGLTNYSITYVNGTLTVNRRDLTVAAIGLNRVYDGTTIAMVMLSTDALGGDEITASCASASFADQNAGSGKAVSVTGISISGADAANYNLLNATASTTADITQKALTITATDRGKAYRDIITFAGTEFTTEGLVGSDTVDSVTLSSAGAEATAVAGAYDIVAGAAAGHGLENYSITCVNGTLMVNKVSLTWAVTSSPELSTPGGSVTFTATVNDPEASGEVTFVDGDVILGTAPLDHGTATLTISGLSAGSHSVTVVYDGDTNFADGTSPAYICQVDAASKSNWWLIVCIAAGAIGGFFCLLFFWRRRQPRQALAASAIGSTTGVAVDEAAGDGGDASAAGAPSASADSLSAEDAVAGNMDQAAVENQAGGSIAAAVAGVGASAVLLEGERKAEYSTEATLQDIRRVVATAAPDVAAHQKRVSELAGSIAREMGLADRQIEGIRLAAELHDIGKVIEPEEAPNQTDKPSPADASTFWDHPKVAFDLLKDVEFEWPIARIVAQHHERLDGSGYPYGIPGKDILLEARIIAVADAVDDMLASHPHRPAMSPEEALAELADGNGSLYDYEVVNACQKVLGGRGSEVELSSPHP